MTFLNVTRATLLACCNLLLAVVASAADPIPGIGPVGEIKKLHGDFQFTEGPAADREGNIYFSDIPPAIVYRWSLDGKLTVFRKDSNSSNGLMFNAKGELVSCEMGGRITAVSSDGQVRVLAETYRGKRFNAPNDLVIDKTGGVYFTDPHFRAPTPLPQDARTVYYIAANGPVTRVTGELAAPNGVILSPDEKTLYVIPSLQAEMLAYPVEGPGQLSASRVFCTLEQPEGKQNTGGDGLTVDTKGNLYITSGLGIQVFSPDGKALGIIAFPEQPANCTFGGKDRKTLFVTARTSLYSVEMEATGHVFPAGEAKP